MRFNIASRAGRWSAGHWKTAVSAWLAFCVVAVALGAAKLVMLTDIEGLYADWPAGPGERTPVAPRPPGDGTPSLPNVISTLTAADLARLGLARSASSAEPEDNLASVLEVMRHLAAAGSDEQSLQRQRKFYSRYLAPAYRDFCDAAHKASLSSFYAAAVCIFDIFMAAELAQFEMAEATVVELRR